MTYDFDARVERRGTDCMKWDEMGARFGREDLLPFWVADMDFRCAPEIVRALREAADFGVFGYPIVTERAREAVAAWQRARHGWDFAPEAVDFVPGVVTGLAFAVRAFTKPGDGVVIQPPVYPPFFEVIRDAGREIVENPLVEGELRYEMDFDHLGEVLARPNVTALMLCSPHNPVGRVWTRGELARLVELCAARGVTILSDEIHQDLVYRDAKHVPTAVAAAGAKPRLVTLVAPSKTFNIAGLCASAWIAEDGDAAEAMRRSVDAFHIERLNLLGAKALETAYREGAPWLDALLPYLERNRGIVEAFVRERLPRAALKHPEGTFVFWLDFRGYGLSADELQRVLVEEARVALNRGEAFGREGEGFARLNVGCPRAQLEEGLARIEKAFKNK